MKPARRLTTAIVLCTALAACPLFPRKADLDAVHDAYRTDFARVLPLDRTDNLVCQYSKGFENTLEAIRGFEAKYRGEKSAEMGHVTVLKAMTHLQAGHFGVARQMKSDVRDAPISASGDREVRDTLFKRAYPALVDGWQAACDSVKTDSPTVVRRDDQRSAALAQAATDILGVVKDSVQGRARRGAEADDGAIYLATSASIFQYYVFRMEADRCRGEVDQTACTQRAAQQAAPILLQGTNAIYQLLAADERKAVDSQSACPKEKGVSPDWKEAPSPGRRRYVNWYLYLQQTLKC